MQRQGLNPHILNAAISTCEKGKQPNKAWTLLAVLARQGMELDTITYSAVINDI